MAQASIWSFVNPVGTNLDSLEQLQHDISRQHSENLMKLETTYQRLINDLIDEKKVIQKQLHQSFSNQLNHLFQLKLCISRSKDQPNIPQSNVHSNEHNCINNNVDRSISDVNVHTDNTGTSNNNKNNNSFMTPPNINSADNTVDIDVSLFVKQESSSPIPINVSINATNDHDDCNKSISSHNEFGKSNNMDNNDKNNTDINGNSSNCNDNIDDETSRNIDKKIVNGVHDDDINESQSQSQIRKRKTSMINVNSHITKLLNAQNGIDYQCNDCNKCFKILTNAQRHVACRHMNENEKVFKCHYDNCNKRFALWRMLNQHKNIHSSRFECNICNRKCSDFGKLTIHKRIHSGEKPYACNICRRKFSTLGDLKKHKDGVHNVNGKEFKCAICAKSFGLQAALNSHKNLHTSKYQCKICGKKNQSNAHLKIHIKTHGKRRNSKQT